MLRIEELLFHTLKQLIVILLAARLFAGLFRRLHQPAAVGEIAAGLALGPSLLGWLLPGVFVYFFVPEMKETETILHVLSQLGLVMLLFLIGLEFDFTHLRANFRGAVWISLSGVICPLILGLLLADMIRPHVAPEVPPLSFNLFVGIAMSITALPVLARMMQEFRITRTRLATITITAAAMDDAMGWILLAGVTALVRAKFEWTAALMMAGEAIAFAVLLIYIIAPLLRLWVTRSVRIHKGEISLTMLAVVLAMLFLAALTTSAIGIFAIFGAFLFGGILSTEKEFCNAMRSILQPFVTVFFLPIFFTYTGLRTNIGSLDSSFAWTVAALISLIAILGKTAGCGVTAFYSGFSRNEALCIGSMMNTRGLMELVVLNVGYDLGVLPQHVFSMFVMMALLTTAMTAPLLRLFRKDTEIQTPMDRYFGSSYH